MSSFGCVEELTAYAKAAPAVLVRIAQARSHATLTRTAQPSAVRATRCLFVCLGLCVLCPPGGSRDRSQIIEKNEEHDKKMQLELQARGLYDTVLWQPTNFGQGNIDAIQRWVAKTFDKHMPEDADLVKVGQGGTRLEVKSHCRPKVQLKSALWHSGPDRILNAMCCVCCVLLDYDSRMLCRCAQRQKP